MYRCYFANQLRKIYVFSSNFMGFRLSILARLQFIVIHIGRCSKTMFTADQHFYFQIYLFPLPLCVYQKRLLRRPSAHCRCKPFIMVQMFLAMTLFCCVARSFSPSYCLPILFSFLPPSVIRHLNSIFDHDENADIQ